jgi:hypothetical protein
MVFRKKIAQASMRLQFLRFRFWSSMVNGTGEAAVNNAVTA